MLRKSAQDEQDAQEASLADGTLAYFVFFLNKITQYVYINFVIRPDADLSKIFSSLWQLDENACEPNRDYVLNLQSNLIEISAMNLINN